MFGDKKASFSNFKSGTGFDDFLPEPDLMKADPSMPDPGTPEKATPQLTPLREPSFYFSSSAHILNWSNFSNNCFYYC